jgi:hypothetical protein
VDTTKSYPYLLVSDRYEADAGSELMMVMVWMIEFSRDNDRKRFFWVMSCNDPNRFLFPAQTSGATLTTFYVLATTPASTYPAISQIT